MENIEIQPLWWKKSFILLLTILCLLIAQWRITHPPIKHRINELYRQAETYTRECQFMDAYNAYRFAAALDGTDQKAIKGMLETGPLVTVAKNGTKKATEAAALKCL